MKQAQSPSFTLQYYKYIHTPLSERKKINYNTINMLINKGLQFKWWRKDIFVLSKIFIWGPQNQNPENKVYGLVVVGFCFVLGLFFFLFFIGYFIYLYVKCYPPSQFPLCKPSNPLTHPSSPCFYEGAPLPTPSLLPNSHLIALAFPYAGASRTKGLPPHDAR